MAISIREFSALIHPRHSTISLLGLFSVNDILFNRPLSIQSRIDFLLNPAHCFFRFTYSMTKVGDYFGSSSPRIVSVWKPKIAADATLSNKRYFLLGDHATQEWRSDHSITPVLVCREGIYNNVPLLKPPIRLEKLSWFQIFEGGPFSNFSVWKMIPPDDYVALGVITNNSTEMPSADDYRCIHKSVLKEDRPKKNIWSYVRINKEQVNDIDSLSFWEIPGTGLFQAERIQVESTEGPFPPLSTRRKEIEISVIDKKKILFTPQILDSEKETLLKTFAPDIHLAVGEKFRPASVDHAFEHMQIAAISKDYAENGSTESRYWLVAPEITNENVDALTIKYLQGSDDLSTVPAYAFFVQKDHHIVDLIYFFYYPYNLGKGAIGKTFGNHVGDWEHVTLRLHARDNGNGRWEYTPEFVYLSAHHLGFAHKYNSDRIRKRDFHPIIFSARGSHGCWNTPGLHAYFKISTDDLPVWPFSEIKVLELDDECSEGDLWKTADNLETYFFDATLQDQNTSNNEIFETDGRGLGKSIWPKWMSKNYSQRLRGPSENPIYRWGNPKKGCFTIVIVESEWIRAPLASLGSSVGAIASFFVTSNPIGAAIGGALGAIFGWTGLFDDDDDIEIKIPECVLNNGPTGPQEKNVWNSDPSIFE